MVTVAAEHCGIEMSGGEGIRERKSKHMYSYEKWLCLYISISLDSFRVKITILSYLELNMIGN